MHIVSGAILDLLNVPRTDTSFGLRRFSVAGLRFWDALPHDVVSATHFVL